MASILDILTEYGNASRRNYPQGDAVEYAMDTMVEFCQKYGYDFSDDDAKELRKNLYLCPIGKGIFQNVSACAKCQYSMNGGINSYNSTCNFSSCSQEENNG